MQDQAGEAVAGAGVGHNGDLAVAEDAGVGDDPAGAGGLAEVAAVARHLAEVEAAGVEGRLGGAELSEPADSAEQRAGPIEGVGLAPECLSA